jgi:hypothetical protein
MIKRKKEEQLRIVPVREDIEKPDSDLEQYLLGEVSHL